MASVTQRIKQIKQPRGGYIKPNEFKVIAYDNTVTLHEKENIHSTLVGMVVDYMTRFCLGKSVEEAFKISLIGARMAGEEKYAQKLISGINGLDDDSISNACRIVGYDVCLRAGVAFYKPVQDINPDKNTISNIKIMVERSLKFVDDYGPITKDGFTFEGGYTDAVTSGDGDFLTKSTLWDFKVSINSPTNAHTLQLLMYYLMGIHSIHNEFDTLENLGFYNPRLNKVYLLNISQIDKKIIEEVKSEVIGYK